jgi:hypothetical protein
MRHEQKVSLPPFSTEPVGHLAEYHAAFRTFASTARQTGKTVLQAITDALALNPILNPGEQVKRLL